MRIAIIGTGYVGLVSGAGFADVGLDVTCVDIDKAKIDLLKEGKVPFYEPGLSDLIDRNVAHHRLHFTTDLDEAVQDVDAVFLAVGTPMGEDGSADLRYLFEAASQVCRAAKNPLVLVTKSTVPVGTADRVRAIVKEEAKAAISVASNPEFLKEGDAVNDFLKPDRIIIGADDEEARALLQRLYRPFMMREYRVIFMDTRSAELTKYAANGMLATRISFMNEIANLCERVGADVDLVRKGISTDRRIGSAFLYPGVGYGGSCFPKDVKALIHTAQDHACGLGVLESVDQANLRQRGVMLEKVLRAHDGELKGKTFAVWGIAFKPRTDDIREAPAIPLIEGLLAAGAQVRAYDRAASDNARARFGDKVTICEDEYAAVDGADGLILMTEWAEFRLPDWGEIKKRMRAPRVFDGRNIYNPAHLRENGFYYEGIGRPLASPAKV
jgi:UDPglucose 6-dehydrogenase